MWIWAALGAVVDLLQLCLSLGVAKDDTITKLAGTILDKLDSLRKAQEGMVREMRFLFKESQQFQIQLYIQSMNNEMNGFLLALRARIDEIPNFKTQQGREENRRGLLALRDAADPHIYTITSGWCSCFSGNGDCVWLFTSNIRGVAEDGD